MSKKPGEKTTHKKPGEELSQKMVLMNKDLLVGNFWYARKEARAILLASGSSEIDRKAAHRTLKMTWPEPFALLAGGLCLAFSVGVAFLVAY